MTCLIIRKSRVRSSSHFEVGLAPFGASLCIAFGCGPFTNDVIYQGGRELRALGSLRSRFLPKK